MFRKLFLILTISLLTCQICLSASGSLCIDSLDVLLKQMPDSCKLIKLNELAYQNRNNSTYKIYADKLLQEAQYQKNDQYQGNALLLLIQYYYRRSTDSMRLLIDKAEPIYLKTNNLESLFRSKGWYIYVLTDLGKNKEVMEEARQLKELSEKLNYPDGKDMVNQALADYYYKKGLYKESITLLEEIFSRQEARNAPLIRRINIIRQLQNMGDQAIDLQTRIYYLDKLNGYIADCEKNGITELDAENPLYYIKYFYHRFYAGVAYSQSDTARMRMHLREAENSIEKYHLNKEELNIKHLQASYYTLSEQYEKALSIYEELIHSFKERNLNLNMLRALHPQAVIYYKLGRYKEAMQAYENYITMNDSICKLQYYEELAKLKAQHDEDQGVLELKELQLNASRVNLWKMGALLAILVVSCIFLIYTVYAHKKHGKLLRKAIERAEESDRLKAAFLSNINHEIRTPLNAIAGFSEILIGEQDEELQRSYATIIRENNSILQQLIDGILSVSRIESGIITFNYTEVSLPDLMNDVYQVAQTKVSGQVTLNYIQGPDIKIETDRTNLGQILTNLLTFSLQQVQNAIVRFGYTLQKEQVTFYVQNMNAEITPEEQGIIFDYQLMLQSWTKGVGLGVNLELAVTKTLVERMGGELQLVSEKGKGTVFHVILPRL